MSEVKSEIEQELLSASALKSKKNEDRQDYLARLCRAVAKVKDEVWEGISTAGQDWNNTAAEALTDDKEIPDFEDDELPVDGKTDEEVDEETEPESVVVKTKDKKAKLEKEEKSSPPPPLPGRKVSACHTIKKMVVKKPTISVAELSEKLKAEGLKVSDVTIATLRSDLRDTLRVLNELKIGEFFL